MAGVKVSKYPVWEDQFPDDSDWLFIFSYLSAPHTHRGVDIYINTQTLEIRKYILLYPPVEHIELDNVAS